MFNLQFINTDWRKRIAQSAQWLCYRLEDGIRFLVGAENVLHSNQAGSAVLQCSYSSFPEFERAETWSWLLAYIWWWEIKCAYQMPWFFFQRGTSITNVSKQNRCKLDVCLPVHRCICVEKKNQLHATECFIALIICSTCFGHFYAHHQELRTMCVITACGVQCLVAGCRGSGSGQQAMRPGRGMLHDSCNIPLPGHIACCPAPDPRQPATKHCTP